MLALAAFAALSIRSDPQTVWLSSLDLSKARQGWGSPHKDRSVDGHALTLHGRLFEHGFGTHSPGLLVINLHEGSTRFQSTVGIDDEVGARGSAEFQILDGKHRVLWRSGILRGGGEPKECHVDLTGLQEIALRVTDAGDGFDYDHADWADAQFTVTGAAPETTVLRSSEPVIWQGLPHIRPLPRRQALGKGIALTPPMGWNSYDCFGDDVTEAEVMANARYVAAKMRPVGWDTVVVDYRWYDPGASKAPNNTGARAGADLTMDGYGRLLPSPNRFPSAQSGTGFKGLADQIHAMGLKFGIHIMRGIPQNAVKTNLPIEGSAFKATDAANTSDPCPWCPDMWGVRGSAPAGQAYYDSIFRLYASWGVDYVKMDDTSSPYHKDEIEAVHDAIEKCGRPIVYSLSPGETPIEDGAHVEAHANLWRVSGDFWDNWGALLHEFSLGARWRPFAGPGHWPDADMLPLGHVSVHGRSVGPDRRTNFTKAEQVTLLTLWCLVPSPLMVGGNLPDNDPWTLSLLTNPEVLAVDQDSLGKPATPIFQAEDRQIWMRYLADGSIALGVFNTDDFDQEIDLDWSALGIVGSYRVRDLWQRKELGRFRSGLKVSVPSHGALLLNLKRG